MVFSFFFLSLFFLLVCSWPGCGLPDGRGWRRPGVPGGRCARGGSGWAGPALAFVPWSGARSRMARCCSLSSPILPTSPFPGGSRGCPGGWGGGRRGDVTANDRFALIWGFAGVQEAATSEGGGLPGIFERPGFQRFLGELRWGGSCRSSVWRTGRRGPSKGVSPFGSTSL